MVRCGSRASAALTFEPRCGQPLPIVGASTSIELNLDGPDAAICVNLLPLLTRGDDCPAAERHLLITLSATFQLLRVTVAVFEPARNGRVTGAQLEPAVCGLPCGLPLVAPP